MDQVGRHVLAVRVLDALRFPELARTGLARELDAAGHFALAELADSHGVDVLVVDSLDVEVEVARQLQVERQRGLPRRGHLQVFVHDRRGGRGGQGLLLERAAVEVLEDVAHVVVEARHLVAVGFVEDALGLQAVAVAHGRDDPHERQAAREDARSAAEDVLALAGHVPVEAEAGSDVQPRLGHVGGLVAAVACEKGGELLVLVACDRGVNRDFETQAQRGLEALAEGDFVLRVDRVLHVVERRIALFEVRAVGVGDDEGAGSRVAREVRPRVVDVVAGAALHVAVLRVVVLELQAARQAVDARAVTHFVRDDVGAHFAQVAFGEGIQAECRQHGVGAFRRLLENIYRREEPSLVAARLVLVRVSESQRVGQTAVKEARVELGGHRREVLLLIVARALEIEGVVRGAAVVVAVVDEFRVEGVRRARGRRRILVARGAEAHVERMVAVDVPVHAGHEFPVGNLHRIVLVAAGVVAEVLLQERLDRLHLGDGGAVVLRAGAVLLVLRLAGQPRRAGGLGPFVLEIGEDEELVLDDRRSDRESERVAHLLLQLQLAAVVFGALQGVALIVVVGRDFEVVRTALGHGVDRAARETALTHVVGGHRDRNLLEGVERDGRTARGKVAADAEGVVECRAVHGHVRLAVVAASDGQSRRGARRLRGEAHDVVHAAAHGGHQLDLLRRNARYGARTVDVHRRVASVGRHHDGFERLAVLEVGVACHRFAQRQVQTGKFDALVTHVGEGHRVGTAGAESLQIVAAVLVGDGAVLRARRGVYGDDRGADERQPLFVRHRTVHSRRRHLRACCRRDEDREHEKEKFLHTQFGILVNE